MLHLETTRLALRDFAPTDWDALNAILSDPEVTRYMHFANWTEAKRRQWFDWCIANSAEPNPDAYNWAICVKETDALIGWLGIGTPSQASMERERDFGYILNRQYWGQGYMTEALIAVLAYECETLGAQRISATCETPNIASARVMEKAGMRYEGTFHDADFEGNWAYRRRYAIHAESGG